MFTLTGSGDPNGSVSGTAGQVFVNTADNSVWISDGGTTWTQFSSASGAQLYSGTGSPEGVVTAVAGSIYTATDTGAVYAKLSGVGNTGWNV